MSFAAFACHVITSLIFLYTYFASWTLLNSQFLDLIWIKFISLDPFLTCVSTVRTSTFYAPWFSTNLTIQLFIFDFRFIQYIVTEIAKLAISFIRFLSNMSSNFEITQFLELFFRQQSFEIMSINSHFFIVTFFSRTIVYQFIWLEKLSDSLCNTMPTKDTLAVNKAIGHSEYWATNLTCSFFWIC